MDNTVTNCGTVQTDLPDRKSHQSRRRQTGTHPTGRRGPGIFRPITSEQAHMPPWNVRVNNSNHHFKPSLTPGLGTRRVVGNHAGLESKVKFSMEPRIGDEAFHEWREAMRRMARLGDGLPKFVRRRVWSTLADRQLRKQHVDWDHVVRVAFNDGQPNPDDDSLGSQIVKDLHRTGCHQFGSDEDRAALKRVLLAYARWNKRVGYCQGFNVIAAAILDVTDRDEREAFKIMVYLIDYVLPESYFAQNLQALSVDIAVFRHLLQIHLPRLAHHLDALQCKAALETGASLGNGPTNAAELGHAKFHGGYEPPLMNVYIIQWFLTLFATCLAPDAVLRIWDSIMLEGSEVILRTAVVMMEFLCSRLLRLKSADQFYAAMSDLMTEFAAGRIVSSQELLFEIYELAPFPTPHVKELREKFMYNIAPLVSQTADSSDSGIVSGKSTSGPFNLLTRWKSARSQHMVVLPSTTNEKRQKTNLSDKKPNQLNNRNKTQQQPTASTGIKSPETVQTTPAVSQSNAAQIAPTAEQCAPKLTEDEYQEVSLSSNGDEDKRSISMLGGSHTSIGKPIPQSRSRHHTNAMSEPYTDSDDEEESTGRQVRSTSCFRWSQLMSLEHTPKRHHSSVHERKQRESISLDSLAIVRSDSVSQEQRRHSLSPHIGNTRLDISDLGPGAVGEAGAPRLGLHPPLAHQARMSTNLTELKSIYRKQLARQRETTLRLPGLWHSEMSKETNTASCLSMTAVLPQKKESRVMTFETSLDTSALSDSNELKNSMNTHVAYISNGDDEVFIQPDEGDESEITSTKTARDSVITAKTVDALIARSELPDAKPDLVGAVQSWQAKAVWTCEPLPPDGCGPDTQLGAEPVITTCVASPTESGNERPTLLELAARAMDQQSTLSDRTQKSDSFESDCSVTYESAKSYPVSPAHMMTGNFDKTTPEVTDSSKAEWYHSIVCQNQPTHERGTNRPDFHRSDYASGDLETASFYTSASQITAHRAPWQAATASFVSRKPSTNSRRVQAGLSAHLTHLPLPLSPKRRNFGAQFGMYKSVPTTENMRIWSNFCDRVQTIGLQGRVLSR